MNAEHETAATPPADEIATEHELLAYPLTRYQQAHHIDDAALAAAIGIAPYLLDELRACPRPLDDPYGIRLARIAEAFGAHAATLAQILAVADTPAP
jgi:hypothetical protein